MENALGVSLNKAPVTQEDIIRIISLSYRGAGNEQEWGKT
jgi:hypothetical protein